eukprot:gnl/TRDRNA2_/TRDRNA2_170548_c2_seq1.p1 gnl/TRDRNA2_/TRDRNA2_170548_c2~~gnl/TRDRNA2_/TRDRNA2_170548_c2_seq1.p1  ORF type:complete len:105 (+),score=13.33 gnl/TRDRNA2_/TRDRNA2_170548_c2_seq1:108-422(+)
MPTALDPASVLDDIETRGMKASILDYNMLMQCLGATGNIVAGFVLISRGEASGVLSQIGTDSYRFYRMLLEACRVGSDSEGASRVQVMLRCFSSIEFHPAASTR